MTQPHDPAAKMMKQPEGLSHGLDPRGQDAWNIRDVEPVAPEAGSYEPGQLYGTDAGRQAMPDNLLFIPAALAQKPLYQKWVLLPAVVGLLAVGAWHVVSTPSASERQAQHHATVAFNEAIARHGLYATCTSSTFQSTKAEAVVNACRAASTPEAGFRADYERMGPVGACLVNVDTGIPAPFKALCNQAGVKPS